MPNAIYTLKGPVYTWKASGGDAALTLTGLAAGGIQAGAAIDLGAAARAPWWTLEANLNYASALALKALLADIWLLESDDNVVWPGNLSSGNASVTAGKTHNLGSPLLTLLGDSTSNGEWQRKRSPLFGIRGRYVMPVVSNSHASTAMDGTDLGFLTLQGYYEQIQ